MRERARDTLFAAHQSPALACATGTVWQLVLRYLICFCTDGAQRCIRLSSLPAGGRHQRQKRALGKKGSPRRRICGGSVEREFDWRSIKVMLFLPPSTIPSSSSAVSCWCSAPPPPTPPDGKSEPTMLRILTRTSPAMLCENTGRSGVPQTGDRNPASCLLWGGKRMVWSSNAGAVRLWKREWRNKGPLTPETKSSRNWLQCSGHGFTSSRSQIPFFTNGVNGDGGSTGGKS